MIKTREEMARFILNRKYFLKLYHVPQKKWRRKCGDELMAVHGPGHSDLFIQTWEELEKKGLLKK